jgi:hypothetical protein
MKVQFCLVLTIAHGGHYTHIFLLISSCTRGTSFFPSLVLVGYVFFGFSLAFPFVFNVIVLTVGFY